MTNLDESRYIYDIIDEFCPSEYTVGSYLFDLDDINENNLDANFKRKLIQKLNRIYPLRWELPETNDELNINKSIRFKKAEDAKSCYICHGDQNLVYITFGFDEPMKLI